MGTGCKKKQGQKELRRGKGVLDPVDERRQKQDKERKGNKGEGGRRGTHVKYRAGRAVNRSVAMECLNPSRKTT